MKYYTKEWYELAQNLDYACSFEPIPDKEYSEEEIQKLYEEQLDRYMKEEQEAYNEPPINFLEFFGVDDFSLEDMIRVNEETGEVTHPQSKEEALLWSREDYEKELERFDNRAPFDIEKAKEEFKEQYEENLKLSVEEFHRHLDVEVDKRLLALNLLPKSIYQKLEAMDEKNEKRFNELEKIAKEIFKNQKIDPKIEELFYGLHDGTITSVGEEKGNIILKIVPEGEEKPRVILCKDAKMVENEMPEITNVENLTNDGFTFLYRELYHNREGDELHMMAWANFELRYLTIKCEEIGQGKLEEAKDDIEII